MSTEVTILEQSVQCDIIDDSTIIVSLINTTTGGSGSGGGGTWGSITGTLSAQTDLNTALGLKVAGPSSAVADDIVTFDLTTGKLIKDSGKSFDTDGTMAANSDAKIPTQKAVVTYVAANNGTTSDETETALISAFLRISQ